MAHTKEYIGIKIHNCQELVDNAISEEQAKVYLGYLEFWTNKLPKKEQPEVIAKKAEDKQKKLEVEAAKKAELDVIAFEKAEAIQEEVRIKAEKADLIAVKKAELAALQAEEVETMGSVWKEVEITIDEIVDDHILAEDFEIEFPGKKAYRHQNGDKFKTIAFKEFLNSRTQ